MNNRVGVQVKIDLIWMFKKSFCMLKTSITFAQMMTKVINVQQESDVN